MQGAILTIGDELTTGYRLDTNSQVISRRLASVPVDVVLHLSVGDDLATIQRWLRIALEAADVVVVTGGLGPTEDDLTRQAVAACFGLELVEDAQALDLLHQRFALRKRPMPLSNLIQAQVPAGSEIILNRRGTASGFYLPIDHQHIFVTPGIPYELEGMLEGFILPRLRGLMGPGRHVRRRALKVYGLPESAINERIRPLMVRGRNPLLGLLPHRGTITVEVVATAATPQEAEVLAAADLDKLRVALGQYVLSEDERELPQVVADMLTERGLTLAVDEVGTGGLLSGRLTEPEGAERWLTSARLYTSAGDAWGGAPLPAAGSGEHVALGLARAARQGSGADVGLAVGPLIISGESLSPSAHGLVWIGLSSVAGEHSRELRFNGDRLRVREWAADAALAFLRSWLLRGDGEGSSAGGSDRKSP